MRVSYEEDLANCFGLQRRGDSKTEIVLSVRAKGNAGQLLGSEITFVDMGHEKKHQRDQASLVEVSNEVHGAGHLLAMICKV